MAKFVRPPSRPCSPATFSIQILLIFRKFKLLYNQYSVIPGAQTWPFWYFRYALSISGIPQVIAHNIDFLRKDFDHVTPAAKGLLGLLVLRPSISSLLQSATIYYKVRLVLQSATEQSRQILKERKFTFQATFSWPSPSWYLRVLFMGDDSKTDL